MSRGSSGHLTAAGPLAPYETALRAELAGVGYTPSSVTDVVRAMTRLSGWMNARGLAPAQLSPPVIEEFLAARRQRCRTEVAARRGLGSLLRFLRNHGAVPDEDTGYGATPVEALLADYRAYLVRERGLAAESVRCYTSQARKFLGGLEEPLPRSLQRLDAAAVTSFVLDQCGGARNVESAKALITALRSLLRFLHLRGLVPVPLAGAVPGVAGWRLDALPRGLAREQVEALLAAPDTSTPVGLRDHAVLVLLARLGLRGGEAAALDLADVDWRAGEITVCGKGARVERLPLPMQVGEALAVYVTDGRPACRCSSLFVTARAPYQPLSPTALRAIMGRACAKAGMPRVGAHRLRHSLATDLLRAGADLTEVGQVLRHRSQIATSVYAKVDYAALRTLARPWPEGGAA